MLKSNQGKKGRPRIHVDQIRVSAPSGTLDKIKKVASIFRKEHYATINNSDVVRMALDRLFDDMGINGQTKSKHA